MIENKLPELEEDLEPLKILVHDHDEKIKDIDVKMQDFNIIDLIRAGSGDGGVDMNVVVGIVTNIEKKTIAKSKLVDERVAQLEKTVFKNTKEIQNEKNSSDNIKRNVENLKNKMEEVENNMESVEKKIDINNEELNDKIETKFNYLQEHISDSIDTLHKEKKNLKSMTSDDNKQINRVLTELSEKNESTIENNKALKNLHNIVHEIKKNIKNFPTQKEIDQMKSDVNALKSGISNCARISDCKELRENQEELLKHLNTLKDQLEELESNQVENSDLQNIKRKVESIVNKLHDKEETDLESVGKNTVQNKTKTTMINSGIYLETKYFDDFKFQIVKEFNNINDNFTNTRKMLDELIESVRNRTSFKDLKALEDAVLSKLEDLKIACSKKFADKNETSKVVKYLDQEIKHIIQVFIRKIEKTSAGESWLLAKKPINNNLCASCEAYIGDLKDNSNNNVYVPWNKYPVKDPNDKLYRMGTGFSKMLQMIKIDEDDKKNTHAYQTFSDLHDIVKSNSNLLVDSELSPKNAKYNSNSVKPNQKSLPKLTKRSKKKPTINSITESEQNNFGNDNDDSDEEGQPKITKIYRKQG